MSRFHLSCTPQDHPVFLRAALLWSERQGLETVNDSSPGKRKKKKATQK